MSYNIAPTIYRVPLSSSDRAYQEPKLHPIPKGNGERYELLRRQVRKQNQQLLYPDGKD